MDLPDYQAVRALQWCGDDIGVRPGWYAINPVMLGDLRPWPERASWPALDTYRPELELMLQ